MERKVYLERNKANMKKIVLIFIIFIVLNKLCAQTFNFSTNGGATVYLFDEEGDISLNLKSVIKAGTASHDENRAILMIRLHYNKAFKKEIAYIKLDGVRGYVTIPNLKPEKTIDLLPDSIITVTDPGIKKKYIPSYMLDVLRSGDTKKVTEYDSYYAREYHDFLKNDLNSYIAYGFEKKFYYSVISNIGIRLHSDDNFIFTDIKKISLTKYECTGVGFSEWDPYRENTNYWQTYFENTSELGIENEVIELTVDGDYLTIFNKTRNKEIITLVCINDSVEKQLIDLFKTEKCDLSKVTWPRHADGTCDYEASSIAKEASFPSNNVALNKTMSVTENLKLRSDEATSTQVLTVMSTGTKVKILELGKAENIDGICSNWVKVEVQSGATDKDGKEIKNGTVGWCYGGYLE